MVFPPVLGVGLAAVRSRLRRIVAAIIVLTCLALASWDLLELVDTDPQLARNLLAELARRLRATNARVAP